VVPADEQIGAALQPLQHPIASSSLAASVQKT
jgi:hypothetical protein